MEKIDEERKKEFKEYEMKKKAEEDHKLAQMTPEERNKAAKEIEETKKHHNEHEELKHPGGREQLEEVWEERDHVKNFFKDLWANLCGHQGSADTFPENREFGFLLTRSLMTTLSLYC